MKKVLFLSLAFLFPCLLFAEEAGERMVKTVDGIEYAFRWCPAGTFQMGSPDTEFGRYHNESRHSVTLPRGFWMMETEVTLGMFRSFAQKTGYSSRGETPRGWTGSRWEENDRFSWENPGFTQNDRQPVTCVSWDDATAFCEWLGKETGLAVQLPTEAQWEYACRAGTTGSYAGDCLDSMGWYEENSNSVPHEVGQKSPNPWGFYDMHGSVWEWCQDPYAADSSDRVIRGGSRFNVDFRCRSADRVRFSPTNRFYDQGFRCALRP